MSVLCFRNFIYLGIFLSAGSFAQTFALGVGECTITKFDQVDTVIQTCKNIIIDNLKVPGGQKLKLNLTSGTILTFRGYTSFEFYEWKGPLMTISGSDIVVRGETGSILDGQGPLWWDGLGTWGNVTKPRFCAIKAKNATIENINILNCPVACIFIQASNDVTIRNWEINNLAGDEGVAPPNKFAHNTDGFGIGASSNNILIEDTIVYNQDDCVAITSGKNITIRRMFCHGSHGLSISGSSEILNGVLIEDSIVSMAENGIHIKTHVDVGGGLISNVTYRNITLLGAASGTTWDSSIHYSKPQIQNDAELTDKTINKKYSLLLLATDSKHTTLSPYITGDSTSYGINIQQNYRNLPAGQPQDGPPKNNIPIRNLKMINIYGNVLNGAVPVYILCAEGGCFDWKWEGVKILGAISDNCTNYVPDGYEC